MPYTEEDFNDLVPIAYKACKKTAKRILSDAFADTKRIDALTNALVPSFLEHVIFVKVKQSKARILLQKLKELRDDDEIYVNGMDREQAKRGYEIIQEHTQKAIVIMSLLFAKLNIVESGNVSTCKSAVSDMNEFIESVEFALD